MGNIENCKVINKQPPESQVIQQISLKDQNFIKQRTNELKKSMQQYLPQKPIQLQKTTTIQIDHLVILDSKKNMRRSSPGTKRTSGFSKDSEISNTEENKENQQDQQSRRIQKAINKISVHWNSFAKIKKKSYLQDYIFIKQIGKGAYGSVCKIKMKYGGLLRAAKIIKASAIFKEKNHEEKFFAEIALPMELDHPNLIKLFEVFEWKKQFVLIMQLCQGGDLFHRIKQSRIFSQKKTSEIMKQILSAVFYMHKKNVMHRDIKPQNMLYDMESKNLKIIDFGTACKFKPGQRLNSLVGTPYYLAPEVIKGQYDEKCDIWSCGVILYIMLCGYPPFNGKNQKQIMEKICIQPVQFNSGIWNKRSSRVKQLIQRMLTKKPQDRISAEEALSSQWMLNVPVQLQQGDIGNQVCSNLKSFHFKNKLKAVVYTYIASQLYSNKDKQVLLKAFREMDKDGDGVIGKDQLIEVFNRYSQSSLSSNQVQKVLQLVDTNGSGLIDFTQFLVAASNQEKILERQRLQNAFNYLDTDHSGYITIQQVKAFLDGTKQTSEQIKKIFDQVDDNGDGQISKKQFLSLLLKKQ